MALAGVKYFDAVSTNKRFLKHQQHEEARIEAMQRRMLGRVWKEKEQLLNDFIQINVKTATGSDKCRDIELKQMAVDPKLVLPLDLKSISLKQQTVIAPVISVDGRGATLYHKKGAKHGRHVELSPKVFERMHKASNISDTLEDIATGAQYGERQTVYSRSSSCRSLGNSSRTSRSAKTSASAVTTIISGSTKSAKSSEKRTSSKRRVVLPSEKTYVDDNVTSYDQ